MQQYYQQYQNQWKFHSSSTIIMKSLFVLLVLSSSLSSLSSMSSYSFIMIHAFQITSITKSTPFNTRYSNHLWRQSSPLFINNHNNNHHYHHTPSRANNNYYKNNNRYAHNSIHNTRLYFGLWNDDNNTNTLPNSQSSSTTSNNSIFQPGSGPTVIIDSNESDQQIYASAIYRTISWVIAALLFGFGLFLTFGPDTAEEFFAGYLVEQSLSVDNLFVFLLLFDYFNVPLCNQDRVLNYGIYGAVVMRMLMIGLGSVALHQFHGILLVFAGILIYSSANALLSFGANDDDNGEEDEDMSENSIVKFSRNLFDSTNEFDGNRFFTIVDGVKKATPLLICLVAVEISDVVFAVDSIPAVFGVTEVCIIYDHLSH